MAEYDLVQQALARDSSTAEADLVQQALARDSSAAKVDLVQQAIFGTPISADAFAPALNSAPAPLPSSGVGDTFTRGVKAGVQGLRADLQYFKAGAQTLVGDTTGAAESIQSARSKENIAAITMDGIETFGQFLETPTVGGFLTQIVSGTGQLVPSAISSISSAGAGAVANVALRGAARQVSKQLSKKLIKEAADAVAKGTADAAQTRLAQGSYEALQEAWKLTRAKEIKAGLLTGAAVAEYVPLTGSNVSEALDAGKPLDTGTVLRAGAVAVPQAAVGVLGEVGLVKLLQNMATKKSVNPESLWGRYAKDMIQAGTTEAAAETTQEAIAVMNRKNLEPGYASADANLRLVQSAFTGFFGGGAIGGAGSVVTSIGNSETRAKVGDAAASVVDKSVAMMDRMKEMVTDNAVTAEMVNGTEAGQTTPEADRDISAQIDAMLDDTSTKEAVWVSGTEPDTRFAQRKGIVKPVTVNGKQAYSAFIPGRGTIIAKTYDVAEQVLSGAATDSVLAAALGYSNAKGLNDSIVVRAYDSKGGIVSEQTTTPEGLDAARTAAEGLAPEGGTVVALTPEEAQIDRSNRANQNVNFMDNGPSDSEFNDAAALFGNDGTTFEPAVRVHSFVSKGAERDSYQGVEENNYAGVTEARNAYESITGETIDWAEPASARISKSTLETAVKLQEASPDEVVTVKPNADGTFRIEIETTPDTKLIRTRDGKGNEESVPVAEFVRREVTKSAGDLPKYRTFDVKAPGSDKFVSVNPVSLTNAGKRLVESDTGTFAGEGQFQSAQQGLLAMLSQLQLSGYEVEVKGVPIKDVLENIKNPKLTLIPEIANIVVAFTGDSNKGATLSKLLKPYVPGATTADQTIQVPETTTSGIDTVAVDEAGNEVARRAGETPLDPNQFDLFGAVNNIPVINYADSTQVKNVTLEDKLSDEANTDTITDPIEMNENSARTDDGIPLTRMNIEELRDGLNTAQNRARGGGPKAGTGPAERIKVEVVFDQGVTFPFGEGTDKEGNTFLAAFATQILNAISGLKNPVAVISVKQFDKKLRSSISNLLTKKTTAKARIALKKLETIEIHNPVVFGKFVEQLLADGLLEKKTAAWVSEVIAAADPKVSPTQNIGTEFLNRVAFEAVKPFTTDVAVAAHIASSISYFLDPKVTVAGRHERFSGGSVIVVNDIRNNNAAGLAMVLAHEFGHALYKEEMAGLLDNKALYGRMWKAFESDRQKSRNRKEGVKQYELDNEQASFEEWYADQVAAWTKAEFVKEDQKPAKSVVDSHFKKLAKRFVYLWKKLSGHRLFARTNNLNETFETYIKTVTERRAKTNVTAPTGTALGSITLDPVTGIVTGTIDAASPTVGSNPEPDVPPTQLTVPDGASFEQKAVAKAVKESIETTTGTKASAQAWAKIFRGVGQNFARNNPSVIDALRIVASADTILRLVDPTGTIANMFYIPSNTTSGLGFVKARQLTRDKMRADLFDVLGKDWDTQEVQDALLEAQSGAATSELKLPKAKALREFLEAIHKNYIEPSNTDIGFVDNYFPTYLNLAEIAANKEAFIADVLAEDPAAERKTVRRAVDRLEMYQAAIDQDIDSDAATDLDIVDPGHSAEAELLLTKLVSRSKLQEKNYVMPPEIALMSYIDRITKRVEWNTHTKSKDGTNNLAWAMKKLNKQEQATVASIINAYLGNVKHLSPFWRKLNSYAQLIQVVTLLPFATFASIPDFAGPIVASREFSGFTMFGKQVMSMIKDKKQAERLANDIGVVMSEAAATSWMSQADGELLDPTVREATEKFFKYIGLDYLTNLSRQFASGMGRQFLLEHANHPGKRSARYLQEYGVTAEQIQTWEKNDFSFAFEGGDAVKAAMVRFVETSVLRPNAAERPIWASDPRFALVWQMKSFIYAFNKQIIGGIEREFVKRLAADRNIVTASMPLMLLTAAAFLPLAALGLELREYAKTALSYTIPGINGSTKYLRSDSMDWGPYMLELWDRSGLTGPISILNSAQRSANWGKSGVATILGPTAESIETIIRDFPNAASPITDRISQPAGAAGAVAGVAAFGPDIIRKVSPFLKAAM